MIAADGKRFASRPDAAFALVEGGRVVEVVSAEEVALAIGRDLARGRAVFAGDGTIIPLALVSRLIGAMPRAVSISVERTLPHPLCRIAVFDHEARAVFVVIAHR